MAHLPLFPPLAALHLHTPGSVTKDLERLKKQHLKDQAREKALQERLTKTHDRCERIDRETTRLKQVSKGRLRILEYPDQPVLTYLSQGNAEIMLSVQTNKETKESLLKSTELLAKRSQEVMAMASSAVEETSSLNELVKRCDFVAQLTELYSAVAESYLKRERASLLRQKRIEAHTRSEHDRVAAKHKEVAKSIAQLQNQVSEVAMCLVQS